MIGTGAMCLTLNCSLKLQHLKKMEFVVLQKALQESIHRRRLLFVFGVRNFRYT